MSCIKSVVDANDTKLIQVHKLFKEWKKNNTHSRVSTDYGLAIKHYEKCGRHITKLCSTFSSSKSYARSMVTTQVINGKVYWHSADHMGWKQAGREPPPPSKNGSPTKVFYNYNRDTIYRHSTCLHCMHWRVILLFTPFPYLFLYIGNGIKSSFVRVVSLREANPGTVVLITKS